MKKFLLIIVALLISIWSLAITASNRTLIIIAKSTSSTTIRPNSLDSIPFYCTYESSDGIVWIDFMEYEKAEFIGCVNAEIRRNE